MPIRYCSRFNRLLRQPENLFFFFNIRIMDIIKLIFRRHRSAFLQMFALTLFSGALGIGTLSYINNHLLREQGQGNIAVFLLLAAAYFAAASIAQILLANIGQQFIHSTQIELVKRIMDTPHAQIQLIGKPKILASLNSDIRSLSIAFTRLPELVQGVLFVGACSLYLLWLSPRLFAVTAVLMLMMIGGTHFVVQRHYTSFRAMRQAEDHIQAHHQTVLDGHKELALNRYRAQRFYQSEFLPQSLLRRNAHVRADAYHAVAVNWGNSIMLAAVGIIFYLSTRHGWAGINDAATISMTILFMRGPLTAAIGAFPAIMQSRVALNALTALGLSEYSSGFVPTFRLPENWQHIRLHNICFDYPEQGGRHFGLAPVNLTLTRGETVFLIGANGSGKSTLSMLLCGLYEPVSGSIFVDDTEITADNREAFRQLFSAVFTDFHLFAQLVDGSGNDAGDEAQNRWLQHLQMHEKARIDNGRILNAKLSQGQKKRLALLAAALENRSILLLDEWAADQDPQFRRVFYEQLLPLFKQQGSTIFAISHDDKYFHHADRILAMNNGRLSEHNAESGRREAETQRLGG